MQRQRVVVCAIGDGAVATVEKGSMCATGDGATEYSHEDNAMSAEAVSFRSDSSVDAGGCTSVLSKDEVIAAVNWQLEEWQKTHGEGDSGDSVPRARRRGGDDGAPRCLEEAMSLELGNIDREPARVLLVRMKDEENARVRAYETAQWEQKRQKRVNHTKARLARRAERERLAAEMAGGDVAEVVTSARVPKRETNHGIVAECDVAMPGPTDEFRRILRWSAVAARALNEVRAGEKALKGGYASLAVAEARRQEELAAGGVVGESEVREGVARQLVLAAAGLDAIEESEWTVEQGTRLQRSRTRRRYEKRVRKALAKEKRELRGVLAKEKSPEQAYFAFVELYKSEAGTRRFLSREEADAIGYALPSATEEQLKRKGAGKRA